jgi:hypothetical protein
MWDVPHLFIVVHVGDCHITPPPRGGVGGFGGTAGLQSVLVSRKQLVIVAMWDVPHLRN